MFFSFPLTRLLSLRQTRKLLAWPGPGEECLPLCLKVRLVPWGSDLLAKSVEETARTMARAVVGGPNGKADGMPDETRIPGDAGRAAAIRVLVVEDEPQEAERLRALLSRYAAERGERFEVSAMTSAVEFLSNRPEVDLVFMDIGLPGVSGMEAAEILRDHDQRTQIIFVTSLAQYGARSYEVDALDFIVKPVSYHSFSLRMDRAVRVLRRTIGRSVIIKEKGGISVIPVSDITAIDVQGHNLAYHLTDNRETLARGTLSALAKELAGTSFVQISSSALVNMDHVRTIRGSDVHTSDGGVYVISRPKRKAALEAIAAYYGGRNS